MAVLGRAVAAALFCLASFGTISSAQAAVENHVFEPVRSLTGICSTSTADPVPDPGLCPGVAGVDHPSAAFTRPNGVATDSFGDIYVASFGKSTEGGKEGRIDIFNPEGFFISEFKDSHGPLQIAVDSDGNLYIHEKEQVVGGTTQLVRCPPMAPYEPEEEEIHYERASCALVQGENGPPATMLSSSGVSINPANDHVFLDYGNFIAEFGSAVEGNPLLNSSIGLGTLENGNFVAVDATAERIYASDSPSPNLTPSSVRVFELGGTHALLETITGCEGTFSTPQGELQLATEEETGHFFIADMEKGRVYEFDENYNCIATIEHKLQPAGPSAIAVDNSPTSPNQGYLFVTSGESGVGHSYAFEPVTVLLPPEITSLSVGEVDETEAELRATIDSGGAEATYAIEYMTRQAFEESGETFTGAVLAAEGTIPPNTEGFEATAAAAGLEPGTEYVFRARVESSLGPDEELGAFGTFPEVGSLGQPCPNEALRTGASALLPDCRAYELVTPADTNGHPPKGAGFTGVFFNSPWASPQGDAASFVIEGGSLPGFEGTGSFNGENYVTHRTASGWQTQIAGPDGSESQVGLPGSPSPDQGYNFWATSPGDEGSAAVEGEGTTYVRYPDGHSALIGRGSEGTEIDATGLGISEGGGHIIFSSKGAFLAFGGGVIPQLEPNAPPEGTVAIYDRTADEVTHVVSLLPEEEGGGGEGKTPADGEDATFLGASPDANGIAFQIGSTIYLRLNNQTTFEVAEGATFAGVSEGGGRVFYLKGRDLFAFDTATEDTIAFSSSGDVTPVNVANGGTRAYLVSPSKLTGEEESEASPEGSFPLEGAQNLYLSEEGAFRFLGTVTDRDVEGEIVDGLGLWTQGLKLQQLARDPSRTNPAGDVFLFESRANLTGFDSGGKAQVYRYESGANTLQCLSCEPARQTPTANASLQSIALSQGAPEPFSARALLTNLTPEGNRAFFQSPAPLVAADSDSLQDVYEWEEDGTGSCDKAGGCTYLISSPHSERPEYLYGMSTSGDDVFFSTEDQLLPADTGATASIYDARVGGGFAEGGSGEPCAGEGCRPTITPPPIFPGPEPSGDGNVPATKKPKPCPKGKHRVKRHGKRVCVKNHKKHHHKSGRAGR